MNIFNWINNYKKKFLILDSTADQLTAELLSNQKISLQHCPDTVLRIMVEGDRLYAVVPLPAKKAKELLEEEAEFLTANSVHHLEQVMEEKMDFLSEGNSSVEITEI
jgi:hypothetical protein